MWIKNIHREIIGESMGENAEAWDMGIPSPVVYRLSDEKEQFEKVPIMRIENIHSLLISENILLIINVDSQIAFIWEGSAVTIHMKFLAARLAPEVRDLHGTMPIHTLDQHSESDAFKNLLKKKEV